MNNQWFRITAVSSLKIKEHVLFTETEAKSEKLIFAQFSSALLIFWEVYVFLILGA